MRLDRRRAHVVASPAMVALLLALLLGACAPTFTRPQVAHSQYDVDLAECRQRMEYVAPSNTGPYGGLIYAIGQWGYIARRNQVLEDCMVTRGYVKE